MDFTKQKGRGNSGKGQPYRQANSPGGRNNPFGATKPKPVVKPVTGKASKPTKTD